MAKKALKVAIVGKAPSSRVLAPYDDESWEIWSLSDNWREIPRWDRWFELHDPEYHKETNEDHYKWLMDGDDKPLYMLETHPDSKRSLAFPRREVQAMFGTLFNDNPVFHYWTNSVSWLIGMAIHEGATEIGIYGCDMAQASEYGEQRPSCEFMVGVAIGRGVKVTVPGESDLMKTRKLYGYETHNSEMYVKIRTRDLELQHRMQAAQGELSESSNICERFYGAMQELQELGNSNGNLQEYLEQRTQVLQGSLKQAAAKRSESEKLVYLLTGAREDLAWCRQWA